MKPYYLVAKGIIDEILIDRVNFFVWRLRIVLSVLIMYFLWSGLYAKQTSIAGYSSTMMLTYILFASIVSSLIFSSRSFTVGDDIIQGNLSNHLLRPYNYFLALFSSDVGDKAMNVLFAIGELTILFLIFRPPVFLQTNVLVIFCTIVVIILAILLYFFFGIMLGSLGFWSGEVWGPRFIFGVMITMLSGQMFPIDMLPSPLFTIAQFSPFTYLIYFPVKIYLGQLSLQQTLFGIGIASGWVVLLYMLTKYIWKKGLSRYTAEGR